MERYYFDPYYDSSVRTHARLSIRDRRLCCEVASCHSVDIAEKIVAALNHVDNVRSVRFPRRDDRHA